MPYTDLMGIAKVGIAGNFSTTFLFVWQVWCVWLFLWMSVEIHVDPQKVFEDGFYCWVNGAMTPAALQETPPALGLPLPATGESSNIK